jgi:hypothetical protein
MRDLGMMGGLIARVRFTSGSGGVARKWLTKKEIRTNSSGAYVALQLGNDGWWSADSLVRIGSWWVPVANA